MLNDVYQVMLSFNYGVQKDMIRETRSLNQHCGLIGVVMLAVCGTNDVQNKILKFKISTLGLQNFKAP